MTLSHGDDSEINRGDALKSNLTQHNYLQPNNVAWVTSNFFGLSWTATVCPLQSPRRLTHSSHSASPTEKRYNQHLGDAVHVLLSSLESVSQSRTRGCLENLIILIYYSGGSTLPLASEPRLLLDSNPRYLQTYHKQTGIFEVNRRSHRDHGHRWLGRDCQGRRR